MAGRAQPISGTPVAQDQGWTQPLAVQDHLPVVIFLCLGRPVNDSEAEDTTQLGDFHVLRAAGQIDAVRKLAPSARLCFSDPAKHKRFPLLTHFHAARQKERTAVASASSKFEYGIDVVCA